VYVAYLWQQEKKGVVMPRWDFSLTVVNETDRDLRVISKSQPWGKEETAPALVKAGSTANYKFYQAGGVAAGYEFTLVFQDVLPSNQDASSEGHYGTVTIKVDVPLSKDNHASVESTGILETSDWDGRLPLSGHDFAKTLVIAKKAL
jgi:hypothetical protein